MWHAAFITMVLAASSPAQAGANPMLDELRTHFTVKHDPVSPLVFRDFGAGQGRVRPTMTAIDLSYALESEHYTEGWLTQKRTPQGFLMAKSGSVTYGYKFVGMTANKLLVALVTNDADAPDIESTIYVMDAAVTHAAAGDGRLELIPVRIVELGDKWNGTVTLKGNIIVIVSAPGNQVNKTRLPQTDMIKAMRPPPGAPSAKAVALLDEVQAHFTIEKASVSPVVFEDFGENDEEHHAPVITAIDLREAKTEKYYESEIKTTDGWRMAEGDEATYGYRVIGTTANKLSIVLVRHQVNAIAGPQMWYRLYVFDVAVERALDDDGGNGALYERIVLTPLQTLDLGFTRVNEKWPGSIRIDGNKISFTVLALGSGLNETGKPITKSIEAKRP